MIYKLFLGDHNMLQGDCELDETIEVLHFYKYQSENSYPKFNNKVKVKCK